MFIWRSISARAEAVSRNAMEGATASMKASTASTPLLLHHRYMVAFPTPARAATPSIYIWWKPTVFRSSYVASRIALRDASLRFRPCAAVVEGAAANARYSRITSRSLVLQREASFVNTAVVRGLGRFVVLFRHCGTPDDPLALNPEGGLQ